MKTDRVLYLSFVHDHGFLKTPVDETKRTKKKEKKRKERKEKRNKEKKKGRAFQSGRSHGLMRYVNYSMARRLCLFFVFREKGMKCRLSVTFVAAVQRRIRWNAAANNFVANRWKSLEHRTLDERLFLFRLRRSLATFQCHAARSRCSDFASSNVVKRRQTSSNVVKRCQTLSNGVKRRVSHLQFHS